MNKKLFLGMFAAAGMLFATSCSNDELDVVQSGNEAQVTFTLATEGAIATRANTISDGLKTNKLVYAVYKLNDAGEPELQNIVGSDNNGQFVKDPAFTTPLTETVTVTLAKAQTYQVAFWAQNADCTAYDTDDLRNVTVDYTGVNNDESRDAFFKMVEFYVDGDKVINDITLERPFAQINVGVYQDDWAAAVASGIEISQSKVVIKNAATSIDLLTGEVNGETAVTYDFAKIPAQYDPEEELLVDLDGDGVKESYKYLSMSYILANDETTGYEKTSLESLDFEFAPVSGNNIELKDGLNAVPVRRNWRTNIIGTVLTGDVKLNITIDPDFIDDYNPIDQLQNVLENGGKITLFSDATLTEELAIPAGKDVEIDLNGNTLKVATECTVEGNLTVGNGTIDANVNGQGDLLPVFTAKDGSTIDFSEANVNVADKNAAVIVDGDDVTINLNLSFASAKMM